MGSTLVVILLVSGATTTMQAINHPLLGHLIVPKARNRREALDLSPWHWAMDNGAYSDFDVDAFHTMLRQFQAVPGCLFVAAPDVVGDARKTLDRFPFWAAAIRAYGYRVALVAQDGLTIPQTPWSTFDALFIGGTTDWKLGRDARNLAAYATAHGKWVHMGRVNSMRRLHYARAIGCNSVDGSGWSKWPSVRLPLAIKWMTAMHTPGYIPPEIARLQGEQRQRV